MSSMLPGRRSGKGNVGNVAAIFVHAGAGYHSIQNEQVHLKACNDAASAAMAILRGGGSAVDAVETAIRILEDREITNAGYGSNLAIDGTVEGDAVVVDHLGRSGACGAVAHIKNPISLARIILRQSTQELTLRRVPPNLLVGQGATDFAFEHGMPVLSNDALVSPAAKERWNRWRADLKAADRKAKSTRSLSYPDNLARSAYADPPPGYEESAPANPAGQNRATAITSSMWNEGQPVTPTTQPSTPAGPPNSPTSPNGIPPLSSPLQAVRTSSADARIGYSTAYSELDEPLTLSSLTAENLAQQNASGRNGSPLRLVRRATDAADATRDNDDDLVYDTSEIRRPSSDIDDSDDVVMIRDTPDRDLDMHGRGYDDSEDGISSNSTLRLPSLPENTPSPPSSPRIAACCSRPKSACIEDTEDGTYCKAGESSFVEKMKDGRSQAGVDADIPPLPQAYSPNNANYPGKDCVTDTVGAIAIDNDGNMACGASSGGIGMKFRGRIGPAALVGVGAAIVPLDPDDRTATCTGAVTSGTGEHMATTLAASVCADRLYHGQKRRRGGGYEHCEDDLAVRAMIENDFMGHTSVRNSHSTGAIGVLAVKKTSQGIYLYFAHNTDSFALASQHADEPKPTCTMSRSNGTGMIASGGRGIKYKRRW